MEPAIVLGGGMNALAVARSLGRRGVPVHVACGNPEDLVTRSRYVADHHRPREGEALIGQLRRLADALPGRPVLFYTADFYLRLVSQYEERLAEFLHVQVPPPEAVSAVSDKGEFARFTERAGLPAPVTRVVRERSELPAVAEQATMPLIVKPARSREWKTRAFQSEFGGEKAMSFREPEQFIECGGRLLDHSSALVVQEHIQGRDDAHYSYCCYRRAGEGVALGLGVQKLRVFPIHRGAGSLIRIVDKRQLRDIAHAALDRLHYTGVASVCFKVDERTGQPMIHEINGRLPQWHAIFQTAGLDLPWIMYCDMTGRPSPIPDRAPGPRKWMALEMDLMAAQAYRRAGELSLASWLKSYRGLRACAEFAWDDPRPFFHTVRRLVRMKLGR